MALPPPYKTGFCLRWRAKLEFYPAPIRVAGFTLIELSIVLVIIGLIIGGVLVGQDLIKAAVRRSVITEKESFQTAVQTFRLKYNCIPGDCQNAETFWGEADADPATCETTPSVGTETCNGNGDKRVDIIHGVSAETFRFWQHLANAGLIAGQYTGATDGPSHVSATTNNVPKSKFPGGLWFVSWLGFFSGTNNVEFVGDYGHYFEIGAYMASFHPQTSLFTPDEAWNIDNKIDDGKPATGSLIIRNYDACTDATAINDFDADYELTTTSAECVLNFVRAF